MRPLLASLFDGLDGVTYFFVSSGIFVLLMAALFFALGLWIGLLTWGRFKRRFRAGQETIEDLKNELALLKRRTADLATRGFPQSQGRSPLAALVKSASPLQTPPALGAAFTIWTSPGWSPQPASCPPLPSSAAFCLWPMPEPAVEPAHATGTANLAASAGDGKELHFAVEHTPQLKPRNSPESRAFTLWTEPGLKLHSPISPDMPSSAAFSIWIDSDFEPSPVLAPPAAPENSPRQPVHSSLVSKAASVVRSIVGFPKAGAGMPTFGDWLQSRSRRSGNGDSDSSEGPISPAEAFQDELNGGAVRNDFLLGIVFNLPPEQRDDLTQLDGITASERDALESFGVHRFKQIAHWNRDHAAEFARRLGMKDKSQAARWIGQAGELVQGAGGGTSS